MLEQTKKFVEKVEAVANRYGFEFRLNRNGNPEFFTTEQVVHPASPFKAGPYVTTERVGYHFTLQTGTIRRRWGTAACPYKFTFPGHGRQHKGVGLFTMSCFLDKRWPLN